MEIHHQEVCHQDLFKDNCRRETRLRLLLHKKIPKTELVPNEVFIQEPVPNEQNVQNYKKPKRRKKCKKKDM